MCLWAKLSQSSRYSREAVSSRPGTVEINAYVMRHQAVELADLLRVLALGAGNVLREGLDHATERLFGLDMPVAGMAGWSFGAAVCLNWQAETASAAPYVGIAPPVRSPLTPPLPDPSRLVPARRAFVIGEKDQFIPYRKGNAAETAAVPFERMGEFMSEEERAHVTEELQVAREVLPPFDVDAYRDGDEVNIELEAATIAVAGRAFAFPKLPAEILAIREAGGLLPYTIAALKEGR